MNSKKKILAVSSGGGHWVELLRLKPLLNDYNVIYATVSDCYKEDLSDEKFYSIKDATRWNWFAMTKLCLQLARILHKEKPDIVLSTGAAPGYLGLRLAKRFSNARTIWIESLARVNNLSVSGLRVEPYADLWLTQWPYPDGKKPDKLQYKGSVL